MGYLGHAAPRQLHRIILFTIFWCIAATSPEANAKIVYLLDIDGTIVNDQAQNAAWRTYWVLKRVEKMHSALQPNPEHPTHLGVDATPPTIELSYAEYHQFRAHLAKADDMFGTLQVFALEKDVARPRRPKSFIPGLYRVSPETTFVYHRTGEDGVNWLLSDYRDAKKRVKSGRGLSWKGLAFPLLQAGMKDPLGIDSVVFSTARDQSEEELFEWLAALRKDGEIKSGLFPKDSDRPRPRAHFLQDPEALLFGHSLDEKKSRVIADESSQLLTTPAALHRELVPDEFRAANGETAAMHTLIVAENDPRYIEGDTRRLEELSSESSYSHRIKFVLFNADESQNVQSRRWPWRWTVFDRGFGRQARVEEIQLWTKIKSAAVCNKLLAGE